MKAYRRKPPADTMFMVAMAMVLEDLIYFYLDLIFTLRFSKFCEKRKIRNFDPHFKNWYLARKWV
jgi:hypothetical protein